MPAVLIVRNPDEPTEVYSDDPAIEVIVFDLGSSYDITDPEDIDEESMVDDLLAIARHLEVYSAGEINRGLVDVREQLVEALQQDRCGGRLRWSPRETFGSGRPS